MQDFLGLSRRVQKPRQRGLTHVIDSGLTLSEIDGLIETAGDYVDIVKLGWGTGYVTGNVEAKVERYRSHGIPVVIGGTLGEIALARNRFDAYCEWLVELGISHIEISDGALEISRERKLELIGKLAGGDKFIVMSEVGSKDPDALVAPFRWVREIKEDLAAGASQVILEARESGNAGVYRPNGEVRMGLIEEIELDIDPNLLIFEAPLKHQQVWFIEKLGSDVNLGNIKPNEVISLETLRLGLRADTIEISVDSELAQRRDADLH